MGKPPPTAAALGLDAFESPGGRTAIEQEGGRIRAVRCQREDGSEAR